MGGQQIASVASHPSADLVPQFDGRRHAVILLAIVLMMIWGLTRLVDIRKEL